VLSATGYPRYYLDMGWPDIKVAVEYDGEQHRVDPHQFKKDVARLEYIQSLGWIDIRVLAGDRRADIVRRVQRAWVSR
jgi:very-short-patch-repair endonuclease